MLDEVYIKDFALIQEIRVKFGPGLNVITGETGAGKSIILGALSLILGSKATTDQIRAGCKRALVEATFVLNKPESTKAIHEILSDSGIEVEENEIFIKREIGVDGRGRSFVNAQQVPVGLLKKIGRYLIDIHGQNEHQNILQTDSHRKILDKFAGLENLREQIIQEHKVYTELTHKLKSVSLNEIEKDRRLEILHHEINEIDEASLEKESELEDLIGEEKSLVNAESILKDLSACYEGLQGEDGLLNRINQVTFIAERVSEIETDVGSATVLLREAYFQLEEASSEIRTKADSLSVDPERLHIVQERIDLIQGLLRKYGATISDVKSYYNQICNELSGIELSTEQEQGLKNKVDKATNQLIKTAKILSEKRRMAAKSLEEKVKQELSDLGMPDTNIRVSVKWAFGENGILAKEGSDQKYIVYSTGLDIVEFLLAASQNDILRPMRKVASGGEMSRIMLSLKKVIIDNDPVSTLIFDEVDAGVGGAIAEAVGNKLSGLSYFSQVVVITHLHQIAGLSPRDVIHLKVEKNKDFGSSIKQLSHSQRVKEVARMIAGSEITETAMEHARNILSEKNVS